MGRTFSSPPASNPWHDVGEAGEGFSNPFGSMTKRLARATRSSRRRRRSRLLAATVIIAALVLGPGVTLWLRASLGDARVEASTERARLHREQRELASARARLGALVSELHSVAAQRHVAQGDVTRTEGNLEAVQGELAATNATIGLQGPHVVLLGQCLDGVSAAMNQSAVGGDGTAAALAAVASTCEQARTAIAGAPPV
jgi:hypothetical protein